GEGNPVQHIAGPCNPPVPKIILKASQAEKTFSFLWHFGSEGEPVFDVSADLIPMLLDGLKKELHLQREIHGEHTIYRFPAAAWDANGQATIELEADRAQRLRRIRFLARDQGQEKGVLTISDIVVGEKLPADVFTVALDAATPVREAAELNVMEVFAQAL